MVFKKVIAVIISVFVVSQVFSQNVQIPDTTHIPEVRIRPSLIIDSVQYIPAFLGVLNISDLTDNNGAIITSALNKLPGVYMQQAALNNNRITLRGIGSRSQYGSDRVKAYINNIPLTSGGETVIDDIDIDLLQRVEVIKGPSSTSNGAGLGGSIAMHTKEPDRNRVSLHSGFGSFGMNKNTIGAALVGENSGIQIAYTRLQSDGYRDNSNYLRNSLSVNGNARISDATQIKLFAQFVRVNAQIPSSLNAYDLENNPTSADRNWAAAKGYESYDKWISGITLEHMFSERFQNSTVIFGQYRDGYEPRPFDILDEEQLGFGARTKFDLKYPLFGKSSDLTFGAEYLLEDYSVSLFKNLYRDFPGNGSIQGDEFSSNNQQTSYMNVFAEQHWAVSEKLMIDAGLHANYTQYQLKNTFPDDTVSSSVSYDYGIILSPRFAVSYKLADAKNIYASVSRGFSTPGVEETLTPSGEVNTDLVPETGIVLESGIKASWFNKKLNTEVAVFTMYINNLLVAQRIAEDQYVGTNAGKTQHTGVEISVNYKGMIGDKWLLRPYFTAALNDFKFRDFKDGDQDFSGNDLTGVPAHTLNLGLESEFVGGFSFRIKLLNVGEIPVNDGNTVYADAYSLLNAKLNYRFDFIKKIKLEVYVGANNLTDEAYVASVLPNAVGFGGAQPRYYYPGDARNFYAGIKLGLDY